MSPLGYCHDRHHAAFLRYSRTVPRLHFGKANIYSHKYPSGIFNPPDNSTRIHRQKKSGVYTINVSLYTKRASPSLIAPKWHNHEEAISCIGQSNKRSSN